MESLTIFFSNSEAGVTSGKNIKQNTARQIKYTSVNDTTFQNRGCKFLEYTTIINGKQRTHTTEVMRLKQTCRSATCFLIATLLAHNAQRTMVIVDQRYVAKTIANAGSAGKIPEATIANIMININVHD